MQHEASNDCINSKLMKKEKFGKLKLKDEKEITDTVSNSFYYRLS